MYSNKENINILTALLVSHGIRHVVVCPGSRNAPLVHNFTVCPSLVCHAVTDERSAGFYALGLSLALDELVAVCVTSGTALLNLSPAVAEASYQHKGFVVISADRPQSWIDQLDGQTLPQPGAFGLFVSKSVSLPEVHDDDSRWYCNRLVNEALTAASQGGRKSVQINVPISEPLFQFDVKQLDAQRRIVVDEPSTVFADLLNNSLIEAFCKSEKPMIVLGQYHDFDERDVDNIKRLQQHAVVLYEPLSHPEGGLPFDELLYKVDNDKRYLPDFLLYGGDTVVSKRLKNFLRQGVDSVFEITEDGEIHDTFKCVDRVHDGNLRTVLRHLREVLDKEDSLKNYPETDFDVQDTSAFVGLWQSALAEVERHKASFFPSYSQMQVVRLFEDCMNHFGGEASVHYANSTSVRLANIYACHYVYCNRGVNGIDGSVSTAAGFSLVAGHHVYCVTGDLSFFYDSNACWNQELQGNFRILLLNNGGGGIFHQLPVVNKCPKESLDSIVAHHQTSAAGICESYHIHYLCAHSQKELEQSLPAFMQMESDRPVLLEVFTDVDEDTRVFKEYYHTLKINQ